MRKRPVKKYGDSWVIRLSVTDVKDLNLEEGDEIDIEDLVILNKKKSKSK